jgi:hypothetical protein
VSRDGLLGLSSHNVFVGHLGARPSVLTLLRAGEVVTCDGSDGTGDAFRVQRIHLPRQGPDADPSEAPTALVIRDLRLSNALRRVEDALMRVHVQEGFVRRAPEDTTAVLGHFEVLRYLSREVRRSRRDGQQLAVVLTAVPRGAALPAVGERLLAGLRGADRVGLLRPGTLGGDAPPTDVTTTSLDFPFEAGCHWFLLVLPCTPTTGAHALVMRLRATLALELPAPVGSELAFGVATLRACGSQGEGDPGDTAQEVIERAHAAALHERGERRRAAPATAA